MWRVILLVFCYHVVAQPATDEPSTRHTRELIECCPCPGSNLGGQSMLGGPLGRASVDDCPCRARGADSEGASSMLFPTRAAAGNPDNSVPFMRSNDPNDMKNLLEPEVGLATSMLQTLREATEEEYQDALARDAARSVDAIPEESARSVVIIVKPRASEDDDDFVSEASNVKEARCINPKSTPLGKMRTVSKPMKSLPDLFKLSKARQPNPTNKNLLDIDSNVGASNVQESLVDMDGGAAGLKSRTPWFNLRTPLKENSLKSSNNDLKTPSVFDKLQESLKNRPNLFERFNLPQVPIMKVDPSRKVNNSPNTNNDLSSTSSNVQELIENDDNKGIFKLSKRPLMLKNLLKLKDVELVPKTIPKLPLFRSKSVKDSSSLENRDANGACEDSTYDSAMNEKVLLPKKGPTENERVNENRASNENDSTFLPNIANDIMKPDVKIDSQDASTSPSEIVLNIMDNTQTKILESEETDCNDSSSEITTTKYIENILNDDELNGTLAPVADSEIEDLTKNEVNSNISIGCESYEGTENENEDLEPNVARSDNTENVIPYTAQDNGDSISLPQLQKPDQSTENILDNDNEDFISVQSAEDIPQWTGSSSEVTNKKKVTDDNPIQENLKTQIISPTGFQENSKSNLRTDTPFTETLNHEPKTELSEKSDSFESKVDETVDKVTFKDLQKLSNDLLVSSSNNEPIFIQKEAVIEDELSNPNLKSFEEQEHTEENEQSSLEIQPSPNVETPKNANEKPLKEKNCQIHGTKQKNIHQLKSVIQDENSKDMSVEASAPIANTLPTFLDPLNMNEMKRGSSLFQNIESLDPLNLKEKLGSTLLPNLDPLNINEKLASPVIDLNEKLESFLQPNLDPLNVRSSFQDLVQPSIQNDPFNFLGKPITEVLKLPTLEDLRQRLSSVFDTNDRSAENNFSDEDGDCTNVAPVEMLPAASASNLRKVPLVRPLENMNVDIFQLNPLTKPELLTSTPRLNMNNFRAKLPIPSNLDLKPVKLEPRVRNNKDKVLGAPLTFGNDIMTLRKPKPNHSSVLGHPVNSLPSLDELRNTLHSGTQSLLGSQLHPNLDLFRDSSLRASGIPDIDEIRRNAEKTMKSLQQRMKSTLKTGKISNPLGEKFARPQDLWEDVNDKLKAIHYDFNDRLSSIHEDILDTSKFKPLAPVFPTFTTNRNTNFNKMTNNRKFQGKPARLQTSASTISSQEIDLKNNDRKLFRSQGNNNAKKVGTDTHRTILGAESSPVASKVEFPKHKAPINIPKISTLPPLTHLPSLRQGSEILFPQNIRAKSQGIPKPLSFAKDLKRPILRKQSPFKDKTSKVTITFATTTASPVTSPMNTPRTTPVIKTHKPELQKTLKERFALPRSKALGNAKQSASELIPSIVSTPVKSKDNFKTANSGSKDLPQLQSKDPNENTKSRLTNFNTLKDSKVKLNENTANNQNLIWTLDNHKPQIKNIEMVTDKSKTNTLVWPKSGEDSFLTKVREAMQARLNNFHPAKAADEAVKEVESTNTDMIKSASENNDIILQEPLKENVSYKCKMVCTRES